MKMGLRKKKDRIMNEVYLMDYGQNGLKMVRRLLRIGRMVLSKDFQLHGMEMGLKSRRVILNRIQRMVCRFIGIQLWRRLVRKPTSIGKRLVWTYLRMERLRTLSYGKNLLYMLIK